MHSFRLAAVAIIGTLAVSCLSASTAFAASPMSNAFVANVKANLDFLAKSSDMARTRAATPAARAFAADQASDAARSDVALNSALPSDGTTKLASADTDVLMTGRSVAIDVPTDGIARAANGRTPMGDKDLAALAKLSGKKFDDALWLKQLDALSQLRADYQAYADDGDDPALGALAERELPKVEARLKALTKI
ncbi:exported protein of unknown function [Beijerinckiaceae bacterium RH AL1]|nr:DUF4142 domain-containing protein [Beijerinckiaceae bacterium]VVB43065.1 exported protein of unknown function [Beijerinckiaceae bacterium RH AL8]VVB43078.1 exported protein of unknown function [Beijerinckiaceae bacterium RH CH11]VVC53650.1 exported protein of unknown function [Beijerinckiaceae bacterium RH AL1]